MVFVEEVAALVATSVAVWVSPKVWSLAEAARVAVDRMVLVELLVTVELPVEVRQVYSQAVLLSVGFRPLVSLSLVAPQLQVLGPSVLEIPLVAEPRQALVALRSCHREPSDVVEVLGQLSDLPVFRLRSLMEASAPLGGRDELLPDLFQPPRFVSPQARR